MFGCEFNPLPNPNADSFPGMEMMAFPSSMESYGVSGALVKMPGVPSGGSTMVYFGCEDCAVEAERAEHHGGKIIEPKMAIGQFGSSAFVEDTEGNVIGLHSM